MTEYNIFEWKQNFEWTWNFCIKLLKLLKQHKTEGKSKLENELILIELKTYYWINMSLLHKHPVSEYKIKTFEWKNNNSMKLFIELNINMKLLNENRNIGYKWTGIEFTNRQAYLYALDFCYFEEMSSVAGNNRHNKHTLDVKWIALIELERGAPNKDISKRFDAPKKTLPTWKKSRHKIVTAFKSSGRTRK